MRKFFVGAIILLIINIGFYLFYTIDEGLLHFVGLLCGGGGLGYVTAMAIGRITK